jgi:hypothetical protein
MKSRKGLKLEDMAHERGRYQRIFEHNPRRINICGLLVLFRQVQGGRMSNAARQPYIREADIMRHVEAMLKLHGVFFWRNNTGGRGRVKYGKIGSGDFMAIHPKSGQHIELECKSSEGKQSYEQLEHQASLERNNAIYLLITPANVDSKWWEALK